MYEVEALVYSAAAQALNPLPFAAQLLNCSGWVVYTVLSRNWFIFCTDAPGLLASIWMTFSLYPYANLRASLSAKHVVRLYLEYAGSFYKWLNMYDVRVQVQNQLNAFMVLAAALWCILAMVTIILQETSHGNAVISLW